MVRHKARPGPVLPSPLTEAGERRLAAAEPSEVLIWEMHAGLEGR